MRSTLLPLLTALLPLAACSGGGGADSTDSGAAAGSGSGRLSLAVTDKPFDHSLVEEALIRVDRIDIRPVDQGGDDGFLVLYQGVPREFDLMQLQNGVTSVLVDGVDLPAGAYDLVRLRVHSGYLLLVNGNLYTTDDGTLHPTSTDKSGLKVFIDPPLGVADGVSHDLLLDFDLTKTFKPVPGNDPLGAKKYLLHPVIRAAVLSETGSLAGIVRRGDDLTPVAQAVVHVLPPGAEDLDDALASTGTGDDGGFRVLGLTPGLYDVFAVREGLTGRVDGVSVVLGGETTVEVLVGE